MALVEAAEGVTARVMQVSLHRKLSGEWQADVRLPDGRDFHAVGPEPGDALIELGLFWKEQRKQSDLETLYRAVIERK